MNNKDNYKTKFTFVYSYNDTTKLYKYLRSVMNLQYKDYK